MPLGMYWFPIFTAELAHAIFHILPSHPVNWAQKEGRLLCARIPSFDRLRLLFWMLRSQPIFSLAGTGQISQRFMGVINRGLSDRDIHNTIRALENRSEKGVVYAVAGGVSGSDLDFTASLISGLEGAGVITLFHGYLSRS